MRKSIKIHAACTQDRGGVSVVEQGQQEMFERRIFVLSLRRVSKGAA